MKSTIRVIASELFQVALVTYLGLQIAETVSTGFVSDFFDQNILLAIVTVSGIATALISSPQRDSQPSKSPSPIKLSERDWYFLAILAIGGGFLIFYKTQELGGISIAISVLAGAIIALLSFLLLTDQT